jgi:hypothetical protein
MAILTMHSVAIRMAAMKHIMSAIMARDLVTSALAVVGLAIFIIRPTASFCSTMPAVIIPRVSNIAVIEANGGIIGIVSTEAVIGSAVATTAVIGAIRTTHGPRDQRRPIVNEAGCAIVTTEEIAITNGAVAGRQMGMPFLRFHRQFRRHSRMLRSLNNRLNPAASRKVHKRHVSACPKAS